MRDVDGEMGRQWSGHRSGGHDFGGVKATVAGCGVKREVSL